ncbi:MAG: hypothetical protein WDA04_00975 [Anaerolineaceae bacterium]|jgi:hypothetical protein
MAKSLTPEQRIINARKLIGEAREITRPSSVGWEFFSYTAQVKDKFRKAFELVKLIQHSPIAHPEVKREAKELIDSLPAIEKDILKP